ncbi:MAG: hypothetical protein KAS32_00345 [Candidatus Peribacteraceae bacterium]|nr:hypothetical protein [Candidatus Peribacteraceae bacterium]
MRVIKFRGRTIKDSVWVYGGLTIIKRKANCSTPPGSYISNISGMPFAYRVDPETIGQYTGLKDKNRFAIYEGDIVKDCDGDLGAVTYKAEENTAEFYILHDNGDGWYFWDSEPIEVISNIHENLELP